jgi:hypothetical protein
MGSGGSRKSEKGEANRANPDELLPVLNPWREVGWIFKDGEAVAVERHEYETRTRTRKVSS